MAKLKSTLPPLNFEAIANRHAALAEPNRVRILHLLVEEPERELSVNQIVALMKPLVQTTVSHHLKILTGAGLVKRRKDSTYVMCQATKLGEDLLRFG